MRARTWLWAGLILTGVNCVAILDGEHPYREDDNGIKGDPCTDDSNCQDQLPCTIGVCLVDEKVCLYNQVADGPAPAIAQTAADCQTVVCTGGNASIVPEAQDYTNDNNSCTTDACVNGVSTNTLLADGTNCDIGLKMGVCAAGQCEIACMKNADCDDMNPCSEESCNTGTGKCAYTYLDGVLTPGATQVPSDCKVRFCSNGVDGDVNDDADVIADGNPCTDDTCTAGTPSNPPIAAKSMCPPVAPSVTGVCDGAGACVECVDKDDCTNITESECEKRSCVNNKCVIAYEPQTTAASPVLQTGNDCKKVVCSGMPMPLTVTINDNTDLPNDANPCTTDTCNNGAPMFSPLTQGAACGNNQVCNNKGDCVGCNAPTDCMGTDDFCKTRTCISNVCGFNYTANGTDLPVGQTTGDCKVLECDGAGNVKTSVLQSDVPVDNNQCTQDLCNAQGTPSNPPTAVNSACSVGANDACDGAGNCKKSLGKTCAAGGDCVSTRCVDGVCCNTACTTLCEACNVAGSVGTCTAVPKGQDDGICTGTTQSCNASNDCDDENGVACAANSACLSNLCVDGVCCNTSCNGTCKACNVVGALGTCSNVPAGLQDSVATSVCIGMDQCDGNGVCKRANGGTCTMAAQCLSGFCADGYCCDTACTIDCKSCGQAGMIGTCSNVPSYTDDGMCSGTNTCDGLGICKLDGGQPCQNNSQCASGSCNVTCAIP